MIRKWIFSAAAGLFTLAAAAGASAYGIGESIGRVYYSGIDTYINNYPIRAYSTDGRQLICAEDLRGYGFTVDWSAEDKALYISPDYSVTELARDDSVKRSIYLANKRAYDIVYSDISVYINGEPVESYSIDGRMMIKLRELEKIGTVEYSAELNRSAAYIDGLPMTEYAPLEEDRQSKLTIVLDPGHGKSSWNMSDEEKTAAGYDNYDGGWGEWRHWIAGSASEDCHGCDGEGTCWYPIGNGDRDTEPGINLKNALAAKAELEGMGYNVRLTRTTNDENPSFKQRVSYCYPNNDLTAEPDASCYVCIHSNAGGGKGSAYIAADGSYTQKWIRTSFEDDSNFLGECINNRIISETSLSEYAGGVINGQGYMILFNKCPVPAGYMEIGFFDSSDLGILDSESGAIGRAIAGGINDYMWN